MLTGTVKSYSAKGFGFILCCSPRLLRNTTVPALALHSPGPDVDHDVYFARESLQDGLRTGVATDVQTRLQLAIGVLFQPRTANIAGTVVQFVLQRGLHGKPQAHNIRDIMRDDHQVASRDVTIVVAVAVSCDASEQAVSAKFSRPVTL